jgi:hypothetical protein
MSIKRLNSSLSTEVPAVKCKMKEFHKLIKQLQADSVGYNEQKALCLSWLPEYFPADIIPNVRRKSEFKSTV